MKISIRLAVDLDSRFVVAEISRRPDFGFFFVPTFDGDIETVRSAVGAGFWAMATAVTASAVSAVSTAIRDLRKGGSSSGVKK